MLRSTHHYPATTTVVDLLRTTKSSAHSSSPDLADSSTHQAIFLPQIFSPANQESDVVMDQRDAFRESIKRMCQLEPESVEDMTPTNLKRDGRCLEEELAATTEQPRHVEEEVVILRHDLDQLRDSMREVESQARDLAHELETCEAELRESEGKRRAGNIRFARVVERLDRQSAALVSSRAEVEELQLECSRATSTSAVLLDRIHELEAQVATLNGMAPQTPDRLLEFSPLAFGNFRGAESGVTHDIDDYDRGLILRPGPDSAQDVKSNRHDDRRLEEQITAMAGLLWLAEEEILILRRDLYQSRKTAWDVESRADDVINLYRTKLSKAEDARRTLENKFVEAVENVRQRSAELKASTTEVEASEFRCSQFIFLSAALQDRVSGLEGAVKLLKSTRDHPAPTVAASPLPFVADTGMGLFAIHASWHAHSVGF
jgi:chromosome segregation ATPase